jgi:hypothetical protein
MGKGSKPGERRGGRQRGTPNKGTRLRDRILAAASANPTVTCRELLSGQVGDQVLPSDIRIAVARKVHSQKPLKKADARAGKTREMKTRPAGHESRARSHEDIATTFARLDLLLRIVRDTVAEEAERHKAAFDIAEFFIPKILGRKKKGGKFPADEFGFSVDPELAREFRDIRWKIACLAFKREKFAPDAFAKKVSKLQARLAAIRQVLKPPAPSRYTKQALTLDDERLEILRKRRATNVIFSPEEDTEEAHRMARLASFLAGPEAVARSRLEKLHQKQLASKRGGGLPLTRLEEDTYRFLATFYPLDPPPTPCAEFLEDHPFITNWPYPWIVGNPNYPEPT